MFMMLGPSGNVHDPQNHFFLTLDLHDYSKVMQEQTEAFQFPFWGKSHNLKNERTEEARAGEPLRSILSDPEHLEYGISIFKKRKSKLVFVNSTEGT